MSGRSDSSSGPIPPVSARGRRAVVVLLSGVLAAYATLHLWSSAVHCPAVDDPAHLVGGVSFWRHGSGRLYAVNPPLVRAIAAIPVMMLPHREDWSAKTDRIADRTEFLVGRDFVAANGHDSQGLFFASRSICVVFGILGGIICFHWTHAVAGSSSAGVGATVLWCPSPSVLAFGSTLASDVAAASVGICALYTLHGFLKAPCAAAALRLGCASGALLLTKFTWLPLFPSIAVGATLGYSCIGRQTLAARLIPVRHAIGSAAICAFVLFSGYQFEDVGIPIGRIEFVGKAMTEMEVKYFTPVRNRFVGTTIGQLPCPLPAALVQGLDVQQADFEKDFRSYLMGKWKHGGWWYYYLVGFLVKEPIGFQLLLYVSILHGLWRWKRWTRETIREWSLIVVPPVLIFALVSWQTGFNHHMRYVLPAYPFLFIIAARTVTLGRIGKWLTYSMLTWQVASVLWFAPHWMSYFNEAVGGPSNGDRWLVDSNIDWGQDVQGLINWQEQHPEATPLYAALFVSFDPGDIGLRYKFAEPCGAENPGAEHGGSNWPQPGWYAISASILRGREFKIDVPNGRFYAPPNGFTCFADHFEPVEMIGYSIYIYHITEEQAAAVRAKLDAE